MDFVAAVFVALFSPSFLISPWPVPVFTVVVRGIFSGTLLQLATASFVLVVSVYFTADVICRPGDEARAQDGDEPASRTAPFVVVIPSAAALIRAGVFS